MSERPAEETAELVRLVKDLLAQLDGTAVVECEFQSGEHRVLVRRSPASVPSPVGVRVAEAEAIPEEWHGITAPLSGIFYMAESPQSPPLVTTGATVASGQVVGLIESMKMFNPVESDIDGTVRAIVVSNSGLVEKGQVLMYVEPRADLP